MNISKGDPGAGDIPVTQGTKSKPCVYLMGHTVYWPAGLQHHGRVKSGNNSMRCISFYIIMETLSALLALCDENPPAIGTFWKIIYELHLFTGPLIASKAGLWYFHCRQGEQRLKIYSLVLTVIWKDNVVIDKLSFRYMWILWWHELDSLYPYHSFLRTLQHKQ